jgi:hypothetical protein
MAIILPITRVIPTPQCDGGSDDPHPPLDYWYEGLVDTGGPISYLCRTCGRRVHITAVFEEVPPGVECHTAAKGAGDSGSHTHARSHQHGEAHTHGKLKH